jgi:hypothetical protein
MRSAIAGPVTPLLGSLGLHGAIALAMLLAVRRPTPIPMLRADAWTGNTVEVDAIATPEAASVPNSVAATAANTEAPIPEPPSPTAAEPGKSDAPALERAPAQPRQSTPHPRLPRPPKPDRAINPPSAAQAPEAGSSNTSTPSSGAFGAEGLPPGVRSLPSAFTRAIPPATAADPVWQTLPIGAQHPFTIAIEIDADGHIQSAELLKEKDGSAPEIQATHLRERVVALLGGGLFALQNNVAAGRELLRIAITLSDRALPEDDAPAQAVQRGFEPPRGATPGRAYFTLASGRHFEAKVQVLTRP